MSNEDLGDRHLKIQELGLNSIIKFTSRWLLLLKLEYWVVTSPWYRFVLQCSIWYKLLFATSSNVLKNKCHVERLLKIQEHIDLLPNSSIPSPKFLVLEACKLQHCTMHINTRQIHYSTLGKWNMFWAEGGFSENPFEEEG